jgi:Na+/H+ antiporter NhaD/arsenite permease-like protein
MGDTFRDPVDHVRTTLPHAGRAMINVLGWPGYSLIVVGMMAGVGCLAAFGTGHDPQGVAIAVVAVLAAVIGALWVAVEHKRIGRVNHLWQHAHPHVLPHRSSG